MDNSSLDSSDVEGLLGQTLVGTDGEKIGKIEDVYLDGESRSPEWALVHTGLFGRRESFVPLGGASLVTGGVYVPYSKALVKDAPSAEPDGNLSVEEEDELYRHYGLLDAPAGREAEVSTERTGETYDRDVRDRRDVTDDVADVSDDASLAPEIGRGPVDVRAEEQLRVSTQRRPSKAVRLRKKVVTENVTTTVPVRKEILEVVEDDLADSATGDPALGNEQLSGDSTLGADSAVRRVGAHEAADGERENVREIILHEERPVVTTETVATERVRVGTETDVDEVTVTEPVRKERVYAETTGVAETSAAADDERRD